MIQRILLIVFVIATAGCKDDPAFTGKLEVKFDDGANGSNIKGGHDNQIFDLDNQVYPLFTDLWANGATLIVEDINFGNYILHYDVEDYDGYHRSGVQAFQIKAGKTTTLIVDL